MSQAIGEVLAFGLGVALSPAAVIASVLMLVAPAGGSAQPSSARPGAEPRHVATGALLLAVFVLLGTAAPGVPLAISLAMGARGATVLGEVRSWMVRENRTIVAVLCLVLAAKLLGAALGAGS